MINENRFLCVSKRKAASEVSVCAGSDPALFWKRSGIWEKGNKKDYQSSIAPFFPLKNEEECQAFFLKIYIPFPSWMRRPSG